MHYDTKEQIIQTVLQMIGQEGIQQITIREIAKRADVNIAAINYHFGSKENLIKQAMNVFTKMISNTFIIMDQEVAPKEKLLSFLKEFAKVSITYPGVTKSFVSQMMFTETSDPMLLAAQKQGVAKFIDIVKQITKIKNEQRVKFLSLQLMSSILYPVLINRRLPDLYDFDYMNKDSRDKYIELLFERFIGNQ